MPWTARLRSSMFGIDVRPLAAQVSQPTLIIHGDCDAVVPLESSKWLATQIPHSRLYIVHGAGHVPTMTYPREVAAAINDFFS
jgi:pimeloyl-[acyl-carrier protein] methyl ester esterase